MKITGECIEVYADKRGTPLIVIKTDERSSRTLLVNCYGKDGGGPHAQAAAVDAGDTIAIETWALEAKKWTPTDGRPSAWFQNLNAKSVAIVSKGSGKASDEAAPVDDSDIPF